MVSLFKLFSAFALEKLYEIRYNPFAEPLY